MVPFRNSLQIALIIHLSQSAWAADPGRSEKDSYWDAATMPTFYSDDMRWLTHGIVPAQTDETCAVKDNPEILQ